MKNTDQNIFQKKIFKNDQIDKLIKEKNFSDAAVILLRNQKLDWDLLGKNFSDLQYVKTKPFQFESFSIDAQFNPGRINSTNADLTTETIKNRECFLCLNNLPEEQKGLNYKNEYLILCNPYPIFYEHFTIVFHKHFPQMIEGALHRFIKLSKRLGKYYSVLYNGPECGASAPDHLHFQAVNKNSLKILNWQKSFTDSYSEKIFDGRKKLIYGINDGLRKYIVVNSKDFHFMKNVFSVTYDAMKKLSGNEKEPMFNIISNYTNERGFEMFIFPRKKHRPNCFFKKGDENLMVSPAVIDLSGTIILPREKDFEKINKKAVAEIFNEVSIEKEKFDYLKSHLKKAYKNRFTFDSSDR